MLAAERSRSRTIKIPLWRNWSEVVAAAAAVFLFVSILFPSVGFMRQRYAQTQCGTQLASIYEGFRNYVSDHDGLLPAVAMTPGSPWWKVGYQGQENYSNTRQPWLLVKHGYVRPDRFLCPGRREPYEVSYDGFKVQNLNDFPSRIYIHYSVRIACPTSDDRDLTQKGVLMADRNPLSEGLPSDLSERAQPPVGRETDDGQQPQSPQTAARTPCCMTARSSSPRPGTRASPTTTSTSCRTCPAARKSAAASCPPATRTSSWRP